MPAELRARSLELLEQGTLTPAQLAKLARHRVELLYDMMEMKYGEDDIEAVDKLRTMASEAAQLIISKERADG